MVPSGWPVHARRVHGWPAAQWQHRADRALLRHLHRGGHLPRVHQDALGLGRLTDQKGKGFPVCFTPLQSPSAPMKVWTESSLCWLSLWCHVVLCSWVSWIKWHLNSGFWNTINISMVASNTTVSNNISNNFICMLSACQNCCRLVEQSNQLQHHKTFQTAHPLWNSKVKGGLTGSGTQAPSSEFKSVAR